MLFPFLGLGSGLYLLNKSRAAAATVDVPLIGAVDKQTAMLAGIGIAAVGGFILARKTDLLKG